MPVDKYDDNSIFSAGGNFIFNKRMSYSKKKAYDFKWAEDCAKYLDTVYSCYGDKNRLKRLQMNYDLYNGNGEQAMNFYRDSEYEELIAEGIDVSYGGIQHHPVIDQIAKAMVGEQQARPLTPVAFDTSGYANNDKKQKRLQLLQESIQQHVIQPKIDFVTQQTLQKYQISDPSQLSPEEQEQIKSEIDMGVQSLLPSEIDGYMRKDYKSPSEVQAQRLTDFLLDYLDIKYVTDEGFKHGIISGEEIYRVGIRHNMPFIDQVNVMGFWHMARPNSHFIEDGSAATYEQYVMHSDIYNWYGDEIGKKRDIERKLESFLGGSYGDGRAGAPRPQMVVEVSRNPSIIDNAPDVRTSQGQEYLKDVFGNFSRNSGRYGGDIRHKHVTWKSLQMLKNIKRIDSKSGRIKTFWVAENYRFNPAKGDVEEYVAWVPQVWQTTILGEGADAIYLGKGPVPYQHKSLQNPWDTKLPYVGSLYSKLMGNTDNVSPMDSGKPWQYKINVHMAKIHELEATDLGKVLLTSFNAKPEGWTWKKFMMMAKYGKIVPIDLQKEGVTPADAQLFKGIDLSTTLDVANKLGYLEFLRNQVALSMSYNPSRLGLQAPTVAVRNNQQNINQSSYQTYDIYNVHNKIVENLLNCLVNVARIAFKENPTIKSYVLDDMSKAELDLDYEMLARSEIAIKIRNSSFDFESLLQIRGQAQAMIQNGLISFPELVKLQLAKSPAQIINIAEEAEEKAQAQNQAQQEQQEALMAQNAEIQKQLLKQQQQFELLKIQIEGKLDVEKEIVASTRFAQQKDIDEDKVNDDYEIKQIQIIADKDKHDKELKFKEKEHSDKVKLEKEKLKIEKIKARNAAASKKIVKK